MAPTTYKDRSDLDVDLDFHGDINLTPDDNDAQEYVGRFTHGTLESVRLFADLSEAERMLAVRRKQSQAPA